MKYVWWCWFPNLPGDKYTPCPPPLSHMQYDNEDTLVLKGRNEKLEVFYIRSLETNEQYEECMAYIEKVRKENNNDY